MPKSREWTKEEVAQKLIEHLKWTAHRWATMKLDAGQDTVKDRILGALFSTLVTLDGMSGSSGLPCFELIAVPHKSDKDFNIKLGDNYFRPVAEKDLEVIQRYSLGELGMLHDRFYTS